MQRFIRHFLGIGLPCGCPIPEAMGWWRTFSEYDDEGYDCECGEYNFSHQTKRVFRRAEGREWIVVT